MVKPARIAPWSISLLSLFLCAALGRPADGGHVQRRSADRCVRYSQKMERGQTGAALSLRNGCRTAVTCTIEWKLVCGGGPAGGVEAASMELERGEKKEVSASAAACDRDWQVTDVRWTCDPVRAP